MTRKQYWWGRIVWVWSWILLVSGGVAEGKRPNVLFIAVDDLRPQLGCYGNSYMVTPNLDHLAGEGRLFLRHYVQVPTCGASRYALMTGRTPARTDGFNNDAFEKHRAEGGVFMPEWFRRQGYRTESIGKISHQPDGRIFEYSGKGDGRLEMPESWDAVGLPYGQWKYGWGAFFGYSNGVGREFHPSPTGTEFHPVEDDGYPDGLIAHAALERLENLSRKDAPFFLAVGFFKPHLPFNAPKKYWDLYEDQAIPLPENPSRPEGVFDRSLHSSGEMFGRYRHPEKPPVSEDYTQHLRRSYMACVSYVDAQIGKLLKRVTELGLKDNTIVVVWGDHGWHLGDQGLWGKHTLFEQALRSTLIVRVPGQISPGMPSDRIVETLDLYPTLLELCGLERPQGLDGESLVSEFKGGEPKISPENEMARSYWKNGKSLRVNRWRLTVYGKGEDASVELYDYLMDPFERRNVAANFPQIVEVLKKRMVQENF